MPDWIAVLLIIAAYLVLVTVIGILAGRGRASTLDEYINAGRGLGFVTSFFLLGASIYSAFAFLGGPGTAYSHGAKAFFILAYSACGLWLMYLMGPRIMRLGRTHGFSTQCELLGARFRSRTLSILVATVSILAFIQYIALQMKGSGHVIATVTGGRVPLWAGALVAYAAVIVYVFWGGLRGVAWTNVFQGLLMIGMAWFLGFYIPRKLYGGVGPMFQQIAASEPGMLRIGGAGSRVGHAEFSSTLLVSFLGFTMWPHLFIRPFNIKDLRTLRQSITMYPLFALFLVPVLIVGFAGIHFVDLAGLGLAPDAILPYMVTHMGFPVVLVGLFGAGALAAAMSTQDAITHAAATVFSKDLCGAWLKRELDQKEAVFFVRCAVLGFGAVAYAVAIFGGQTLVGRLVGAYGSIVQILPVAVAALYWRRATAAGVIAGFSAGVLLNFALSMKLIPSDWTRGIHTGLWGLLLNVTLVIAVSLATRAQPAEHVRQFTEEGINP